MPVFSNSFGPLIPIKASKSHARASKKWRRIAISVAAIQFIFLIAAGLMESLPDTIAEAKAPALLLVAAAVAWAVRLILKPESLSSRHWYCSEALTSRSWTFAVARGDDRRREVDVADLGNTLEQGFAEMLEYEHDSFEATETMIRMSESQLSVRIEAYRARIRQLLIGHMSNRVSCRRTIMFWTAVGISLEIAAVLFAVQQTEGGPEGLISVAALLAAGALGWSEVRKNAALEISGQSIKDLGVHLQECGEIHTELSFVRLVEKTENTLLSAIRACMPDIEAVELNL